MVLRNYGTVSRVARLCSLIGVVKLRMNRFVPVVICPKFQASPVASASPSKPGAAKQSGTASIQ